MSFAAKHPRVDDEVSSQPVIPLIQQDNVHDVAESLTNRHESLPQVKDAWLLGVAVQATDICPLTGRCLQGQPQLTPMLLQLPTIKHNLANVDR
jgi:hypothetical protein